MWAMKLVMLQTLGHGEGIFGYKDEALKPVSIAAMLMIMRKMIMLPKRQLAYCLQ